VQAPVPVPEPAPVPVPAPEPSPAAAPAYAQPALQQRAGFTSYIDGTAQPVTGSHTVGPTRGITVPGVILALSPLPQFALFSLAGLADMPIVPILALVAGVIATIVLAIVDRVDLAILGFRRPAAWMWIFLGPLVYIIVRTVRTFKEARMGLPILWIQIGTTVAIGLYVAVAAVMGVVVFQSLLDQQASLTVDDVEVAIAQSVEESTGVIALVTCPGDIFLEEGAEFSCTVSNADNQRGITYVTIVPSGLGGLLPNYTEVDYPE
jgi:hypothetical protein